jgi:hypothetical protein
MIDEINDFLSKVEPISLGYSEISFFKPIDLEKEQIGYNVHPNGSSLTSTKRGDWKAGWIAIGCDGMGDPIIADIGTDDIAILTAMHGEGTWEPIVIADRLTNLDEIIKLLKVVSYRRTTGDEMHVNPISGVELETILDKIKTMNKKSEMEYWEAFLEG